MEKKPKKKYKVVKAKIPEFDLSPKVEKLQRQLDKDPKSIVFHRLAEEYRKSNMTEEAIFILEQSIEYHPNYYAAKITLAKCYIELGETMKAKQVVDKSLEKSPNNAMALSLAADIAYGEGDYRESREFYIRLKKINPMDQVANKRLKELDSRYSEGKIELSEMSPEDEMQIERTVGQEEENDQAPGVLQGSGHSQQDVQMKIPGKAKEHGVGDILGGEEQTMQPAGFAVEYQNKQQPHIPAGVEPDAGVDNLQYLQQQAQSPESVEQVSTPGDYKIPETSGFSAVDQTYMQPEFDTYAQPESVVPTEGAHEAPQELGEPVYQQEGIPRTEGTPRVIAPVTNGGGDVQSEQSEQIPDADFLTTSVAAPQAGYDIAMSDDVPTVSQEVAYQKPATIPEGQDIQDEVPVKPDIILPVAPNIAVPVQDSLYSGPATQSVDAGMDVAMTAEPFHADAEGPIEQLQSQADQILPDKIEPSVIPSEIEFPNIAQPDNHIASPVQLEPEIPMQQPDIQVKQPGSEDSMVTPPPSLAAQGGSPAPILESNQIPKPGDIATQKMKKVSSIGLEPPSSGVGTENVSYEKLSESGVLAQQPPKVVDPHDISIHNMPQPADLAPSAPLLSNSQSTENYDMELAEFYTKQGRLDKAIEIYKKLLQSNPSNHELGIKLQEAETLFNASGGSVQTPNDNL